MLAPLRLVQSPAPCAKATLTDIHFDCPECLQAIVIDASAGGAKVQCPMCGSVLLVPGNPSGAVSIESPRICPVMGLAHGAGQEALDGKQTELAAALEEATRLLAETKRLHDEKVTAMTGECERLRTDFAKARVDLVAVAEQSAKGRADSARNESEFKALIISLQAELQNKTSELQRERDQAAGTMESLTVARAENAGLCAQLSDLERHLTAIREERAIAQAQLAETEDAMRKAAASADGAREELDRRRQEQADAVREHERLTTAMAETAETVKRLQQHIDTLETEVRQRGNERDELQAGLDVARQERQEAFAQIATKDAELRVTSARLCEEAAAANARGADLQGRIDALLAEAETARISLEAARAERDEVTQKGAVRDAEMREISAQLERQKTAEHTLHLHLQAAERNSAGALEKVRVFEAEREPIKVELAKGCAALDEINAQLKQTKSERHAAHERVAEMETELARTVDQLQAIENERDMVKSDLEATRAGLERAKQHITVLQSRRDHMRDEVARLKAQLGVTMDAVS